MTVGVVQPARLRASGTLGVVPDELSTPLPPRWLAIADVLDAEIRAGDPAPGERLPGVQRLRARFGVQQETVVRALWELSARGLVVTVERSGTWVVEDPPGVAPRLSVEERLADHEARLRALEGRGLG